MRRVGLFLLLLLWAVPLQALDYQKIKQAYYTSYQFERRGEYARA